MSENEKEYDRPKRKTSIWAKISFFSALSYWIVIVFLVGIGFQVTDGLLDVTLEHIVRFSPALMIIAFLSAVVGSIRIIAKRDILKGWGYIACSSVLIIMFIIIFISITRESI